VWLDSEGLLISAPRLAKNRYGQVLKRYSGIKHTGGKI